MYEICEVKGIKFNGEKANYYGFIEKNIIYLVSYPSKSQKYLKANGEFFQNDGEDDLSEYLQLKPRKDAIYETLTGEEDNKKKLDEVSQKVHEFNMSWY